MTAQPTKNSKTPSSKTDPSTQTGPSNHTTLSTNLDQNIAHLKTLFPIPKSFDIVTRDLYLGSTRAYWVGINGFCRTEVLQQIFSDLQNPLYMETPEIEEIKRYMNTRIGYAQATLVKDWDKITLNLLSGPSVLLIDGFDQAIILDTRTYPARSVEEPDTERVTRGSRDGFIETLLYNTNLIRRRIRSPKLTFEILTVGSVSQTDVALAYIDGEADAQLLKQLKTALRNLKITSLTMGAKSLEELLIPKSKWHPLPAMHLTERPDVACSFLSEGHVAVIVDNSPTVLILPNTIFQFTQSPEDYYKSTIVGTYFRFVRFLCIPVNLLLLPVFLLITVYYPQLSAQLKLLSTQDLPGPTIIFYVLAVELLLDLFKYSTSLSSSRFSGSLSIIGGLIIGEIAVDLNWASPEILFYASMTLLTTLALSSIEFADGIKVYRMFLIVATAIFGPWGFWIGCGLVVLSILTTPTFAGRSYFWPLVPFNWKALKTLLFRYSTTRAQPSNIWEREGRH